MSNRCVRGGTEALTPDEGVIPLPVLIGDISEPDIVVSHISLGFVGQVSYFFRCLLDLLMLE